MLVPSVSFTRTGWWCIASLHPSIQHPASSIQHPASSIQHPASSIPVQILSSDVLPGSDRTGSFFLERYTRVSPVKPQPCPRHSFHCSSLCISSAASSLPPPIASTPQHRHPSVRPSVSACTTPSRAHRRIGTRPTRNPPDFDPPSVHR